jgi:hypothetical protein
VLLVEFKVLVVKVVDFIEPINVVLATLESVSVFVVVEINPERRDVEVTLMLIVCKGAVIVEL